MSKVDYKQLATEAEELSFWQHNRFWLMIGGALGVAFFLVLVSLNLYVSSEAILVDLSLPEYAEHREEITRDDTNSSFASEGPLNATAFDEFESQFDKRADSVLKSDGFAPEAMSDAALSMPQIID